MVTTRSNMLFTISNVNSSPRKEMFANAFLILVLGSIANLQPTCIFRLAAMKLPKNISKPATQFRSPETCHGSFHDMPVWHVLISTIFKL